MRRSRTSSTTLCSRQTEEAAGALSLLLYVAAPPRMSCHCFHSPSLVKHQQLIAAYLFPFPFLSAPSLSFSDSATEPSGSFMGEMEDLKLH